MRFCVFVSVSLALLPRFFPSSISLWLCVSRYLIYHLFASRSRLLSLCLFSIIIFPSFPLLSSLYPSVSSQFPFLFPLSFIIFHLFFSNSITPLFTYLSIPPVVLHHLSPSPFSLPCIPLSFSFFLVLHCSSS